MAYGKPQFKSDMSRAWRKERRNFRRGARAPFKAAVGNVKSQRAELRNWLRMILSGYNLVGNAIFNLVRLAIKK